MRCDYLCLGMDSNSSHTLLGMWKLIHAEIKSYHQTYNISRTLVSNTIVALSDAVGASPVGAAPTTSSFSTPQHLASIDCAETITRRDEKHLNFEVWCGLYWRFECNPCYSEAHITSSSTKCFGIIYASHWHATIVRCPDGLLRQCNVPHPVFHTVIAVRA